MFELFTFNNFFSCSVSPVEGTTGYSLAGHCNVQFLFTKIRQTKEIGQCNFRWDSQSSTVRGYIAFKHKDGFEENFSTEVDSVDLPINAENNAELNTVCDKIIFFASTAFQDAMTRPFRKTSFDDFLIDLILFTTQNAFAQSRNSLGQRANFEHSFFFSTLRRHFYKVVSFFKIIKEMHFLCLCGAGRPQRSFCRPLVQAPKRMQLATPQENYPGAVSI